MGFNKIYKTVLVSFIALTVNSITYSQVSTSVFERITNKDGLSQSTVNDIIQDKNGFMWFATYGGLNKYDGYSFKVYQRNDEDSTSLSSNGIIHLMGDNSGYIWVINNTNTGLDRFDPGTEKSTCFIHDPSDKTSLGSNEVFMVFQDRQGKIWISTRNGLNLFVEENTNTKTNAHFKQFDFNPETPFFYIFENKASQLLLFTDSYLYYFDRKAQQYRRSEVRLPKSVIHSVDEDKNGNLYVGTSEDGVIFLKYDTQNKTYQKGKIDKLNTIPKIRNYLLVDSQNRLWIGTESKALFRYEIESGKLINYLPDKLDNKSISDKAVTSLFFDNSGILWVGTYSQGLCKYDTYRNNFVHFKAIPGNPNSLNENVVASIHSTSSDKVWIGQGLDGGVTRIIFNNNEKPQFIHYKHDPKNLNSIQNNTVFSLVERKNGEVWLGSLGGGLSIIMPEKEGHGNQPQIKRFRLNWWTFSLFEDSDSILWAGTWGGGLCRYDDNAKRFIFFMPDPNNPQSLCDDVIWAIGEDKYKNIWVGGHTRGLSIIPASEKLKPDPVFINFQYKKNDPKSLSNNVINAFCLDRTGSMWIATAGGVNKVIDHKNALKVPDKNIELEFRRYTTKDGLPSDAIAGIVEDLNGNLWLSTTNGLSKFTIADTSFTNYYESDGLQSNEFWHNSYFINSEGRIFFGGPNGFNVFYPDKIKLNPVVPKVVLTDLKLFNQSIKVGQKIENEVVLQKPIYETSSIELSHKSNVITFEFAALHYAYPSRNQFAYKMEGFDEKWTYSGNNRAATYTNLDPGKYKFRVKASNNNRLWNEEGTSIEIVILPQWWATWWFKSIIILLILAAVLGFIRWRTYRLKKRSLELEELVNERTYELIELNDVLNKNNELLRDKQSRIEEQADELEMQKEELLQQRDNLKKINDELNKNNELIMDKQTRIEEQAEELTAQKDKLQFVNKDLEKLNATKDKLFSIIGHDLRSPFNVILGFSKMFIEKIDVWNKDKQKRHAGLLYSSAQQVYNLLDNLLLWARTQQEGIQFNPEEFGLTELIDRNIKTLTESAKTKSITLKATTPNGGTIFADRNMIQIVIHNLISNAIKFSFENSVVEISSEKRDGVWLVSVKDSGTGIDTESQAKIFHDDVYTTKGTKNESGSGLGLLLCKEFVNAHNGKIWFESKKERGTTFYFTIPVVKNKKH